MNAGGLVMERRMMQGVKHRAEGRIELANIEAVEIMRGLLGLVAALAGEVLFPAWDPWPVRLLIAVLATP